MSSKTNCLQIEMNFQFIHTVSVTMWYLRMSNIYLLVKSVSFIYNMLYF